MVPVLPFIILEFVIILSLSTGEVFEDSLHFFSLNAAGNSPDFTLTLGTFW